MCASVVQKCGYYCDAILAILQVWILLNLSLHILNVLLLSNWSPPVRQLCPFLQHMQNAESTRGIWEHAVYSMMSHSAAHHKLVLASTTSCRKLFPPPRLCRALTAESTANNTQLRAQADTDCDPILPQSSKGSPCRLKKPC